MPPNVITASLVEDIQHALEAGRAVGPVIAGLREATLTGIMEYGCLRWAKGPNVLPPVPQPVLDTPLGKALASVGSGIGVRLDGPSRVRARDIKSRVAEFACIEKPADLDEQDWGLFEARFCRSAQGAGLQRREAGALQGALREMAENALIHSEAPIPALVGYHVVPGMAQFCVADVGIGVLASLRTCPDFQHIGLHKDAIREALKDGTSRFGRNKGGFGFRSVFKALVAQWGQLRFRSGEGCVIMDGMDLAADKGEEHFPPSLPGFQVSVACRTVEGAALPPVI